MHHFCNRYCHCRQLRQWSRLNDSFSHLYVNYALVHCDLSCFVSAISKYHQSLDKYVRIHAGWHPPALHVFIMNELLGFKKSTLQKLNYESVGQNLWPEGQSHLILDISRFMAADWKYVMYASLGICELDMFSSCLQTTSARKDFTQHKSHHNFDCMCIQRERMQ